MIALTFWREIAIAILLATTATALSRWSSAHDELVSYKATAAQERLAAGVLADRLTKKSNDTAEKLNEQHKADLLTQGATIEANFRARYGNRNVAGCGVRIPVSSGMRDPNTTATAVDSQSTSTTVLDEPSTEYVAFAKACGADAKQVMDFQKLVRGNPDLMTVEGE